MIVLYGVGEKMQNDSGTSVTYLLPPVLGRGGGRVLRLLLPHQECTSVVSIANSKNARSTLRFIVF